mmetsp:Transcript_82454/g.229810  ORF Transcript_82454/g.229810 Transcript_82454/m.229810 type:complete len:638 (+) Transcript_82454:75-1988(+)
MPFFALGVATVLVDLACKAAAIQVATGRQWVLYDSRVAAGGARSAQDAIGSVSVAFNSVGNDVLALKRWLAGSEETHLDVEQIAEIDAKRAYEALSDAAKDELVLMTLDRSKTSRPQWLVYQEARRDKDRVQKMEQRARVDAGASYASLPEVEKDRLALMRLREDETNRRQWHMYLQAQMDTDRVRRMDLVAKQDAKVAYSALGEDVKDELVLKWPDESRTDRRDWWIHKTALEDKPRVSRMEAAAQIFAEEAYRALADEEKVGLLLKLPRECRMHRRLWLTYQEALKDKPLLEKVRAIATEQAGKAKGELERAATEAYQALADVEQASGEAEIASVAYRTFVDDKDTDAAAQETVVAHGARALSDADAVVFNPSALVCVFSKPDHVDQRSAIRASFQKAGLGSTFVMRFVLCESGAESFEHDDIIVTPCDEVDKPGLVSVMNAFQTDYARRSLLIMLEDDTFVAWNRFKRFLNTLAVSQKMPLAAWGNYAYMGVEHGAGDPIDRVAWHWLQDVYPNGKYPTYMEGSLVVLGRGLVTEILDKELSEQYALPSIDQAIGVWMDMLQRAGVPVKYINIPGRRRAEEGTYSVCYLTWAGYPFLVHHGLKPDDSTCLAKADTDNVGDRRIDGCFSDCQRVL